MSYSRSVVERFYEAIAKDHKPRKPGIHVSDISRQCLRASWFRLHLGEFQTPNTMASFWRGRKLHETQILPKHEFEVSYKFVNGGEITATIDEYDPDTGLLLDKKTCTEIPKEAPKEVVRQMEYYAYVLKQNEFEVNTIQVLYYDIVKSRTQVFTITPRDMEQIEEEIFGRLSALLDEDGPLRNPDDPYCSYCPYGIQCFKGDDILKT